MIWKCWSVWWVVVLLLAACGGKEEAPPAPQPSSPQAQIQAATPTPLPTRIVTLTPRPSPQATAAPTLADVFIPYEGNWSLMLRYEISDNSVVDKLVYTTNVPVVVGFDGLITGRTSFNVSAESSFCAIQLVDVSALEFTITGNLEQADDHVYLNLTLLPVKPNAPEVYNTRCVDELNQDDETLGEINQAILFPLLQGANQMNFRFDLTTPFSRSTIEGDVVLLTNGAFDGQLAGEIYFGR